MSLSFYLAIPLVIFFAVIQSTVTASLALFGVSPDLVLLFTVSWVLLHGRGEGVLIGLVGGVILDALSGASFGIATISLTLASMLAGLGEINVFRTAKLLPYITIGLATLIYDGVFLFLLQMTGHVVKWGPMLLRVLLPALALNTLCMSIIFGMTSWFCSHVDPQPVEWQ